MLYVYVIEHCVLLVPDKNEMRYSTIGYTLNWNLWLMQRQELSQTSHFYYTKIKKIQYYQNIFFFANESYLESYRDKEFVLTILALKANSHDINVTIYRYLQKS